MKANLAKLAVIPDADCPLCGKCEETVDHIYFECDYSTDCCEVLSKELKIQINTGSLEDCNLSLQRIRGRFRRQVLYSYYAGLLYSL